MPSVKYNGPEPTRRVGFGMLIRGQEQTISQEDLDLFRSQLLNCTILGDAYKPVAAPEEVFEEHVDEGDDGIPDNGWTRANIVGYLKEAGVQTRAGLTKAQLLKRVEEHLNPPELTEDVIEGDVLADNNGDDE
jgi:hypothetical protein